MVVSAQNDEPEEYIEEYVDDMSGQILDTHLVREARQLEMKKFSEHEVYTKVPISEAIHVTGKKPIGSRWIDINKGDSSNPNYRSRLVAKEIKREADEGMFAAMPPLEAKKCLFSMVMTQFARARCKVQRPKTKLLFIDVSRAYFYAPARRPVYVALPQEDYEEGMCGRLNVRCGSQLGGQVRRSFGAEWISTRQIISMRLLASHHRRQMCSPWGRLHICRRRRRIQEVH